MKKNERIYLLKGIAIFSVICAHVAYDSSENYIEQAALNLLNTIGTIGVIIFFLLAGYLFSFNQDSKIVFWKKKLHFLVLPWFLCGTLTYLHVFSLYSFHNWGIWFEKNIKDFSWWEYIKFLLGWNSLYYFMTMLIFCFFLFIFYGKNKWVSFAVTLISLLWIVFIGSSSYNLKAPYMNPMNWIGYFGIGVILGKRQWKIHKEYLQKVDIIIIGLNIVLLIYLSLEYYVMNYWDRFFFPFIVLQVIVCWNISIWIENRTCFIKRTLLKWGKDSFYIYLLHMMIQSVPVKYLGSFGVIGILARPFLTILLVEIGIKFFCYCFKKILMVCNIIHKWVNVALLAQTNDNKKK